MLYYITLTKHEVYEVEADSPEEAEKIGLDFYENDKYAFAEGPIDKIDVKPASN